MYYNGLGLSPTRGPGTWHSVLTSANSRVFAEGIQGEKLLRCLIAALLVLTSASVHAQLPAPVLEALRAVDLPASSVSAVVQGVDAPTPALRYRADVAVNPASVMKLVTTYSALELLGP